MHFDTPFHYFEEAFAAASWAVGNSDPNPAVGAVLVDRTSGEIIGWGFTQPAGGAHAEVAAVKDALRNGKGELLQNSALFVTLEPCSHFGRTPPCTTLIQEHKIPEVHIAYPDPSDKVSGIEALRGANVEVTLYAKKGENLPFQKGFQKPFQDGGFWSLGPFFHREKLGRPRVHLKWAMTKGGKLAPPSGPSGAISSPHSREALYRLRKIIHGVVATPGTVLADRPRLDARWGRLPLSKHLSFDSTQEEKGMTPYLARLLMNFEKERPHIYPHGFIEAQPIRFLMIPPRGQQPEKGWSEKELGQYVEMQLSLKGRVVFIVQEEQQGELIEILIAKGGSLPASPEPSPEANRGRAALRMVENFNDFESILSIAAEEGCNQVMVEGGPIFSEKLWQEGFVDSMLVFHSQAQPEWEALGRGFSLSLGFCEKKDFSGELQEMGYEGQFEMNIGGDRFFGLHR